jgi:hypothetical protein
MTSTKLLDPKKISSKLTMTTTEQRASHKGMAHFAGTGPNGRTCRECSHWDQHGARNKYDTKLKDERCKKFSALAQGKKGQAVPADAFACKYFDLNPNAPELYQR